MAELRTIAPVMLPEWNGQLDPLPDSVVKHPYWQHENGQHAPKPPRILGSIMFWTRSVGKKVQIRHLVLDDSIQWVIGQNVAKYGQTRQLVRPILTQRGHNNGLLDFLLVRSDSMLYLPFLSLPQTCKLRVSTGAFSVHTRLWILYWNYLWGS